MSRPMVAFTLPPSAMALTLFMLSASADLTFPMKLALTVSIPLVSPSSRTVPTKKKLLNGDPLGALYGAQTSTFSGLWIRIQLASMGSSRLKFASGNKNFTEYENIYALMMCTPDLSSADASPPLPPPPLAVFFAPPPLTPSMNTTTKEVWILSKLDFATIRAATNNFSSANKLGEGGFGLVYKGKLSIGQEIAVKQLRFGSQQGEVEFKNEIVSMAKLQHKNIVRLLGFCFEGKERLLIYEFVPNASLDRFTFDPTKQMLLNWETRYKIIVGIARRFLYLQEDSQLKIIHRDLRASNVLLVGAMNPKIADFGTASGYMSHEYANYRQFSVKTDVFNFGVLIIEIMSGKKNGHSSRGEHIDHLLSYAWKKWREGKSLSLIDQTLWGGSKSEMMRYIHIGLLCVQDKVAKRPTMASIVLMLTSLSISLPLPSKPGFFIQSSIEPHVLIEPISFKCKSIVEHPVNLSINEASITEPWPR
ncbi:hypothetical protein TEA_021130 [Camellia sinensis var. sinensis]|uniref:non-specific serine/threonine protein kinase n=1 Tax=Camellia sinensis var. sinensis TaxID=542762 RepID=A0A4S4DRG1_CAMSN|nr:hypothetical protein TEA_021130 [Camellia sinensis var. sinensis]